MVIVLVSYLMSEQSVFHRILITFSIVKPYDYCATPVNISADSAITDRGNGINLALS